MNALFCSQKLSLFSTYLQKGSIKSFLCSLTTMGHFPFILIFIRVTFIDMGRRGQGRTVCSGLHSWDNSVYQKFRQCSYASHILCVDSSVRTFSNSIIWASINLWKQHSSRGLELLVPYKSEPTIWRSKLLNQFIETHYMCLGCLFSHVGSGVVERLGFIHDSGLGCYGRHGWWNGMTYSLSSIHFSTPPNSACGVWSRVRLEQLLVVPALLTRVRCVTHSLFFVTLRPPSSTLLEMLKCLTEFHWL